MSAHIRWRVVSPTKGHSLDVGAGSSFMEALRTVFGQGEPIALDESSIPYLKGMSASWDRGGDQFARQHPCADLIEAIEAHDSIEVWAEY